ncbi:Crossover junction endodeoxyribonuclease RuvC [compost metagenome]
MRFNDNSFIYRIMGIDNGSSQLGMVIADLDLRSGQYTVLHADTFVAEKMLGEHTGLVTTHGARWARQNTLRDAVARELRFFNPHAVAVETPFFMPRRVQSFETLTEMMIFIRQAVEDYNPGSDIYRVTPGEAKRAVQSANFTMKKVVIKDCVRSLSNITYKEGIRKDALTEHEYDAIAVIVAHGEAIRKAAGFLRG